MKHLVTCVSQSGFEIPVHIAPNLDDALKFAKEKTLVYFGSKFCIYSLDHPLTVRYLDNNFFID